MVTTNIPHKANTSQKLQLYTLYQEYEIHNLFG